MMEKALFVTNINDLESEVFGGVQICSQYFLQILKEGDFQVEIFQVKISNNFTFRLLRKLRLDSYRFYNPKIDLPELVKKIRKNEIGYVFLNKAELIRYSKPLRREFKECLKIIVLSHGNESGDYLHDVVLGKTHRTKFGSVIEKYRLGIHMHTESFFRRHFIDMVCCLSETEEHIEKWLGAKATFFIPQIIGRQQRLRWEPQLGVIGFVGTLNHTPNYEAIREIIEQLNNGDYSNIKLEIIGGPPDIGEHFEKMSKQVNYRGRLNEEEMEEVVRTWAVSLNPIFWHSKGASMKLSKAIGYEIPIITTEAGRRGYTWLKGNIPTSENNVTSFLNLVNNYCSDKQALDIAKSDIGKVKESIPTASSVGTRLKMRIMEL